jgi:hypothetical protein
MCRNTAESTVMQTLGPGWHYLAQFTAWRRRAGADNDQAQLVHHSAGRNQSRTRRPTALVAGIVAM